MSAALAKGQYSSYLGAAAATGWLAPTAAAVVTLALLASKFPDDAVLYGVLVATVLWLLPITLSYLPFTSARLANQASYGQLEIRLIGLTETHDTIVGRATNEASAACKEAEHDLQKIKIELGHRGIGWTSGNAYITAWQDVHRAEEALLGAADEQHLLSALRRYGLRLKGSAIPHSQELQAFLDDAKRELLGNARATPPVPRDLPAARALAQEVGNEINVYRDSCWNSLLQMRNQTMTLLVLTDIAAYALLAIAVVAGVNHKSILTGAVFYVVGAAIGFFTRLSRQSSLSTAIEDYGLTVAQMLTIPVYSGLAAVAGVLLYAFTASLQSPEGATHLVPTIDQALSLTNNPVGVVLAAAFGATPDLVLRRLGEAPDKYMKNLISTQPTDGVT